MSELNRRLDHLENCISHQKGARKAFGELKAFLNDEEQPAPPAPPAPEEVKPEGGSAPLGDDGGGASDGDTPTEDA